MTAGIKSEVRIGDCRLILGDCRKVLPGIGPIDAIVSDPPYGVAFSMGGGTGSRFAGRRMVGDQAPFDPAFLFPPAPWGWQPPPRVILFGADHYARRLPADGTYHVWDKDPKGRSARDSFSDVEIVWTSWKRHAEVFPFLWKGCSKDGREQGRRVHATQKPIAVMEWCLAMLPKARAGTILDPFMGSGTTLVACARQGRAGIGIEIERDYFETAVRRVTEEYDRLAARGAGDDG
jgi:DNA modification methylase